MNVDSMILYALMLIIIIQFIWSKTQPPKMDRDIHHFSDKAKEFGQKQYNKVLHLNRYFQDKKTLEEYALLIKDSVQSFSMYIDTAELSDIKELERQAIYWMKWAEYYEKRIEKLNRKYRFINADEEKN
jgi:coenzyme F420-reducing hydrogenase alpha subunit